MGSEAARPWEKPWESLKVNESKIVEQVLDDEDRQARFWRRRPDGFTVNEKEHIIYQVMSSSSKEPRTRVKSMCPRPRN